MARPGQGHQDHQEDVTLSAWRGSSREARLTQRIGEDMIGNVSERVILATFVSIINPCFCICIGRLDVPRMHAMASP